jgi:hypothetical protein
VRLGKPPKSETYGHVEVAGISVYYRESLASLFAQVTVKTEKLLFFRRLAAVGERS